jgi:cytochrome c oxidase accessory protein FixG
MLDESGVRRRVIPAEVKGYFRRLRTPVYFVLLVFFLILPWIQFHGRQALFLDIQNRRFEIFGLLFESHDGPFIFLLLGILVIGIFLVTALWGRVWCGWACPQTVFIDTIYRRIEIWIEGTYIERRRLYEQPMNFSKFTKYSFKWIIFIFVSSIFSHSFIAYFVGSKNLLSMMEKPPTENWTYFVLVSFVTALVTFNFGWFREQFCVIMCPYGRFQSVLTDRQSLSIVYNETRGEPRKRLKSQQPAGDCVSCNRCVQVCPTAIDIRNGYQLECIGCTACVDACDEIMLKVHKPKGLISYSAAVPKEKVRLLRPRVLLYLFLFLIFSGTLGYQISVREPFTAVLLRAKDTPYQLTDDGWVINHFKVNLHNQSHDEQRFTFHLPGGEKLNQAVDSYDLPPGESKEVHLFVSFQNQQTDKSGRYFGTLEVKEEIQQKTQSLELTGVGPGHSD